MHRKLHFAPKIRLKKKANIQSIKTAFKSADAGIFFLFLKSSFGCFLRAVQEFLPFD